jgi:hypothetical protein
MQKDNSIFSLIKNITSTQFADRGVHLMKLLEDWHLIVENKDFQKTTYPYKISWNNNSQGILYVHLENKIMAPVFSTHSNNIIEKINALFGYKCIIGIKFIST